MLGIKQVHHIAIIASRYQVSKDFYCDILGFTLIGEVYREARDSWKGIWRSTVSTPLNCSLSLSRLRGRLNLNPVACAIWPSALTILMPPKRIWNQRA